MKISAVIPTYNSEKYIVEAIKSLVYQSYKLTEIIVVDGGSADSTIEIVEEMNREFRNNITIKLIALPQNFGVSFARNQGVKNSVGDWVLFLDSDDKAEESLVMEAVKRINSHEIDDYNLVYPAYRQIDNNGVSLGILRGLQVKKHEILGYELVRNTVVSPSGVLIKKNALIATGGFNTDLMYSEDWDLWLRLAQSGGFLYIDLPLVNLRRHEGNTSSSIETMVKAEKSILSKYNKHFIKEAIFNRELHDERNTIDYASLLYRLDLWDEGLEILQSRVFKTESCSAFFYKGIYYINKGEFDTAKEFFEKVILENPRHSAALNNLGAICLLKRSNNEGQQFFLQALESSPGYMDALYNLKEINKKRINNQIPHLKFTLRELRPVLMKYQTF